MGQRFEPPCYVGPWKTSGPARQLGAELQGVPNPRSSTTSLPAAAFCRPTCVRVGPGRDSWAPDRPPIGDEASPRVAQEQAAGADRRSTPMASSIEGHPPRAQYSLAVDSRAPAVLPGPTLVLGAILAAVF